MISYAEQKTLLIKTRESVSLIRVLDDENKPIVGTLYLNCLSNSKKRFESFGCLKTPNSLSATLYGSSGIKNATLGFRCVPKSHSRFL